MLTQHPTIFKKGVTTSTASFFSSFFLFQSHCCCTSLLPPPSTCHPYQSLSLLPDWQVTSSLLYTSSPPALSGEVSSHHHLGNALLFFSHSSSLYLLATPCCSNFKGIDVKTEQERKLKWQFGVTARREVRLRNVKVLDVKVVTGGLSVNIMDDWLQAPSVSCRAARLKRCPACWPELHSKVEALSHQDGLDLLFQVSPFRWVTCTSALCETEKYCSLYVTMSHHGTISLLRNVRAK